MLFISSRDAIMTLEPPSWRFTAGNPATVEMFRTGDSNRLVRTAPWELSPEFQPDGRPSNEAAKAMIEMAMQQGSHSFEWRHKRLDGEEFPASVLLTRVELDGRTFLQATVRDITNRKRAEAALRENEGRFRQVTETIDQVFWMTTTDKKQMLYISPGYERIWGRTCQSLYDSPATWVEAVHPADRPQWGLAADASKQAAGEYNVEYRILRPDGSERWIHDRAFPVRDASGNVLRITGVAEDVTDRKRAEERIARLSRVQAVLAGIDRAIVHIPDQQRLLDEVCRVAVEKGGFKLAWIGMVSPDGQCFRSRRLAQPNTSKASAW